jgi:peptidoglycan glycosyltransferase
VTAVWRSGSAMSKAWIVVLALFALPLLANIRTVQAREEISRWPGNSYASARAYDRPGEPILSSDGLTLAESDRSGDPAGLRYVRRYPVGERFAGIVGYRTLDFGRLGLDGYLWSELVGSRARPVTLTLDSRVQAAAEAALADREGAVVVLEVATGRILALYSAPTFDPVPLGSASLESQTTAANRISDDANPGRPRLNRAIDDTYAPGSTMKPIVLAAALDAGIVEDGTEFPVETEYAGIPNSGGRPCGGTVELALRSSCNTSFARIGDLLGAQRLTEAAAAFGFGSPHVLGPVVGDEAFAAVPSSVGSIDDSSVRTSAIGQGSVRATPLQMAVAAATLANEGRRPSPFLWGDAPPETSFPQAISPESARTVSRYMTVGDEFAPGASVGLKTGTAEFLEPGSDHAWMIGFAGSPGAPPAVAFAVFIHASNGPGQTGGGTAQPVAEAVVRVAMEAR